MPYKDPQARRDCRRRWRDRNPEYHSDYKVRNRTRVLELRKKHNAARRARKLGQFIEHVEPTVVYQMHGGMCGICKQFIEGDFHIDHVIPLSKGGMHGYVNVQPAHPRCNLKKGAGHG